MNIIPAKVCSKCLFALPLYRFGKRKDSKDGLNGRCKHCLNTYSKKWKKSLPKEKRKHYNEVHKRYMHDNESQRLNRNAGSKAWRQANPERFKKMGKNYYEKNRKDILIQAKTYRLSNRVRRNHWNSVRRARKRNAGGSHTTHQWLDKLELYKGYCHWCLRIVKGVTHKDHVIPLAKGGSDDITNVVPSCASCNLSKKAQMPHEFAGRLF